jgi:hypothetical protein
MGWDNSASEKVLGRSVMVFFSGESMKNPWEMLI